MASLTIDEFVARLENSRVLEGPSLTAVQREVDPVRHEVDTECYARKLVKEGTLTQWQSDQLFAGRKQFVVGDYRLTGLLGRGGMGAVFEAEHIRLKRSVALKTLGPELVGRSEQVARFQKEIEAASALESPHVVRALDAIQVGKSYGLVMELVVGEPLSKVSKRRGRLPVGEACEYIRQAALGLQHAHEKGMVHRDIKPGNLILTWAESGEPLVKIFDLGLARFVNERIDKSEMTRTGQVMGTPDYMSPEQGWDTRSVDIRGDIYSLGCTAFRLITGQVPFSGANPLQTLMVRCSNDAPSIRSFLPELSEPTEVVIAKMLARDPAERFQTPGEVATALVPFCEVISKAEFTQRSAERVEPVEIPAGVQAGPEGDSETGFNRFLNASNGTTANLPLSVSEEETFAASDSTSPAFPTIESTQSSTPPRSAKSGSTKHVPIAIGGTCLVVLLGGLSWFFSGGGETQEDENSHDKNKTPAFAAVKLLPISELSVKEGEQLRATVQVDGDSDGVAFRLRSGHAPIGMQIDRSNGQLTWTPEESDGPATLDVIVEALRDDNPKTSATETISISVEEVDQPPIVEALPQLSVVAGQTARVQLRATDHDVPKSPLRFTLAPGVPEGARLDTTTGEFTWTPPIDANVGQRTILALVSTENAPKTHTAIPIRVRITPASPRFDRIPELTITAGDVARLRFKVVGVNARTKLAFELLEAAPEGVSLDPRSGEFTWATSQDTAKGKIEFPVRVTVADDPARNGSGRLVVNITERPSTTPPNVATNTKPGPTVEEIKEAEKQARNVFGRQITSARSVTERVELAAKMLTRAKDAGNTPLALGLYRLAREYALKGRSIAVALEATRLVAREFGTDLIEEASECLSTFKPRDSNWFDEQQVIEIGLAAARSAIQSHRYREAEKLISVPESILRRSKDFDSANRLKGALDYLSTIRAEVPDESRSPALSESAKLARTELLDELTSWEFAGVFSQSDGFSFFRHTSRDLPDFGRSLWTFQQESVDIDVPKQPFNTGFVDRAQTLTDYTLRLSISTDTTAGMLCIGVPQTGAFEGLRLHLSSSQFCFLRRASGTEFLARPASPVSRNRGGWDQIEVRVTSGHVSVLVNNQIVIDTDVDAQTSGFIGLDSYLGNAAAARIRIQNARVRAK